MQKMSSVKIFTKMFLTGTNACKWRQHTIYSGLYSWDYKFGIRDCKFCKLHMRLVDLERLRRRWVNISSVPVEGTAIRPKEIWKQPGLSSWFTAHEHILRTSITWYRIKRISVPKTSKRKASVVQETIYKYNAGGAIRFANAQMFSQCTRLFYSLHATSTVMEIFPGSDLSLMNVYEYILLVLQSREKITFSLSNSKQN